MPGTIADDIEITPPNGVTITRKELGGRVYPVDPSNPTPDDDPDNPVLSNLHLIYAAVLDDTVTEDVLENIQVTYPVRFEFNANTNRSVAQKPFIKVKNEDGNSLSVEDNTILGVKMDAYVTAIDVSGMRKPPANIRRFVVFSKDGKSVVCEADNALYC